MADNVLAAQHNTNSDDESVSDVSSLSDVTDGTVSSLSSISSGSSDASDGLLAKATPEHVKARASLKQEILALIKPHRHCTKRPPFSTPEMIVMAIICGSDESSLQGKIARMILATYPYYALKTLNRILDCAMDDGSIAGHPDFGGDVWDGIPKFLESFRTLEVHITKSQQKSSGLNFFTVTPSAARIFLGPRLCNERKGTFPFFRLSAELRNNIYEMVLRFHPAGVAVGRDGSELLQHPEDDDAYHGDDDEFAPTFPVSGRNVAAMTMVCKQAYAEAMPILCGQNKFLFGQNSLFYLKLMAIEHLRKILLYISPRPRAHYFQNIAHALAPIKRLQHLTFHASDHEWLIMSKIELATYGRKTKFIKVEQFPGVHDLAQVAAKAHTFEVEGECPRIKAFFSTEIEHIKAGKGSWAPKKRMPKSKGKETDK